MYPYSWPATLNNPYVCKTDVNIYGASNGYYNAILSLAPCNYITGKGAGG